MSFKILKVWPFWPQGLLYHDQYLDLAMRQDGVSTLFIAPEFEDQDYIQFTHNQNANFDVVYLRSWRFFGKPFPYDWVKFFNICKQWKPDVVHVFGISNFISILAVIVLKVLGESGRVVFNDHSDPRERKNSLVASLYYFFFRVFFRLLVDRRATVITPDLASENEIKRRYGPIRNSRLVQIPLGYDCSIFNNHCLRGERGKKLIIGFAGKINEAKRLEIILSALKKVDCPVECRLVGMPPSGRTEYQAEFALAVNKHNLSCKNKVSLEEFISTPSDLAMFYNKIDVAVFPGSISITTQEAAGSGTPIILYESYEGLEHRIDEGRGWLFSKEQELVTLINHVHELYIDGRIDRRKISLAATKYSWRKIKLEYYRIYLQSHESKFLNDLVEGLEREV